jgi:hypothetical protein
LDAGPLPRGSCKLHSIKVSLCLLNNDILVRRVFEQAEMRFQKQDSQKMNL